MWQCPKCRREFKNTNQNHYCGDALKSIDEYIAAQPEEVRSILVNILETIRAAAPNATEKMLWQMPTFWQSENLVHFAAFKKHISIYPGEEAVSVFKDKLADYKTNKGTVQLPLDMPIDYRLIDEIIRWRVRQIEKSAMALKVYEFEAVIQKVHEQDSAYIAVPFDIRAEFGKERIKVHATFDGEPYDGSIVNMGVKNPDNSVCYIIGVRKDIRFKIGKQAGDSVLVTIKERT
jgi:uncharacterized protein YdhG (YjbR/CyaY superfamily)